MVASGIYTVLGVQPAEGRLFSPADATTLASLRKRVVDLLAVEIAMPDGGGSSPASS